MSIIPLFDDYLFPERRPSHYYSMVPNRSILSNVLNEGFRELQKLERHLGELQGGLNLDPTKGYTYNCSVAGYCPEELHVDVEGSELVIKGEHKSRGDGQTLHRCFTRRFTLPQDINKERIECNINEKGQLEVVVPKLDSIEKPKSQSIPIGFKSSTNQKPSEDNQEKKENGQ